MKFVMYVMPSVDIWTVSSQIVLYYWFHYVYILKFFFYVPHRILNLQWKNSMQLIILKFLFKGP
jgi:hypothetical protein